MAPKPGWRISAPGKAFLLGEYGVLHGAPALLTALHPRVVIRLRPLAPGEQVGRLSAPPLLTQPVPLPQGEAGWQQLAQLSPLVGAIAQVAERFCPKAHWPAYHLHLDSTAFYGSHGRKLGMGSSGALSVALLAALYVLLHPSRPRPIPQEASVDSPLPALPPLQDHWQWAQQAHQLAQQGKGSGADVATSLLGGSVLFVPAHASQGKKRPQDVQSVQALLAQRYEHGPQPIALAQGGMVYALPPWPELAMGLLYLSESISTTAMLQRLQTWRVQHENAYGHIMATLSDLSHQGLQAWLQQQPTAWLQVLGAYQDQLWNLAQKAGMPMETPEQHKVQQWVRQGGGVYKSSGAGGGDIGLVAAHDRQHLLQITTYLAQQGFKVTSLGMQEEGLTLQALDTTHENS